MSSLYHEGILGQKWGVRHGPPYPLGYSAHSAKQKRLNSKSRIDGDPETGGNGKRKGLTDKQKTTIKIGMAAVGVGLAAYGGYRLYKSGALKDFSLRGKNVLAGSSEIIGNDSAKTSGNIISNAIQRNKDLCADGSENHCANIFMQIECQERGLNAEALSRKAFGNKGRSIDEVVSAFKGADLYFDEIVKNPKSSDVDTREKFAKYLMNRANMPTNSRGYASITMSTLSGKEIMHAVQWKLSDGNLSITDGIRGEEALDYLGFLAKNSRVGLFRTDNLTIDEERIRGNFVK